MKKLLSEYIETKEFKPYTAGYVKEDGSLIILDEYHGEDESLRDFRYPEFSNTHPEEDTCIRLYKEPNQNQYKTLEYIIDYYLDNESYCKIEIWNIKTKTPDFYKIYSLFDGACKDYQWNENVGNWTGYKLVQIIKNNINKLNEDLNEVFDLNKYINDRFSNNLYNFPVDGPSYITPDGQFIDIIGISEDMGDDFPEDFPCHGAIQTIMSLEGKADKGGYYDDGSPLLRKNGYIRVNDIEQENNYIELSNIKPTYDQYMALEKWLDHNSHKYNYITICTEQFKDHQKYSYSEYITDDIVKNIQRYYTTGRLVEDMKDKLDCFLTENLLLEMNRGQLINKSKKSDNYKDQSKGRNRWERRNRSRIATRVDQYNKIDMNDFFKKDELKVGINIHGETNDYVVLIRYNGALREIAEQIKRNNNKLEFKCILIALQRVFNSGNVFVSCSCLHPSTKIKLLDGTVPTIEEMKDRFDKGEELWVYSTDSQGDFKPGKVENVWITKTTTDFIEVTLDNNEKIITTPEHLYMLRTGEYIQAKDLKENDSLMPMYFNSSNGYETIKLNSEERGWRSTYKLVAESLKQDEIKEKQLEALTDGSQDFSYDVAIHHKDFHRRNNNPNNLVPLTAKEHWYLHAHQVFEERSEEAKERIRKSASERAKIRNANPTEKMIQNRKNFVEKGRLRNYDEDRRIQQSKIMSKVMKEYYENIPEDKLKEIKQKRIEGYKQAVKAGCLKTDRFHKAALERGKQMHTPEREALTTAGIKRYYSDPKNREAKRKQSLETMILKVLRYLIENNLELTEENYEKYRKTRNSYPKITKRFKNINEAVSYFKLNHKVINIKYITLEETPVYDITVKDWNNFVVDSGVVLHNCADWKYRQSYNASKGGYNSGPIEVRSSDITNPGDTKGAGCKHVNLVLSNIDWIMKVASVINNYIHYIETTMERKYADIIFPKLFGISYDKAVQLNLFDTDDNLDDSEEEIKLSNRYGRERGKFRPGSNKNPVTGTGGKPFNKKEKFIDNPNEPKLDLNMARKENEIKQDIKNGTN